MKLFDVIMVEKRYYCGQIEAESAEEAREAVLNDEAELEHTDSEIIDVDVLVAEELEEEDY